MNMKKYIALIVVCLPIALFSQKEEKDKSSKPTVEEQLKEVFKDENFKAGFKDALTNLKLIKEENYAELIKFNTKLIKKNKKNESAYTYRATGYYFMEQYDEALVDINKALKLKKSAGSYHIKANVLFALGQYEKVIEVSEVIIKKYRDYKELSLVMWGLGMAYYEKSNYTESISNFKKYYIMTNDEAGRAYVGYCNILLEDYEEGIKILNSIKSETVKDQLYNEYLGIGYKGLGDYESSKTAFLKTNELSKGVHDYEVGESYFNTQNFEKAIEYYTKYIAKGSDDAYVANYYRGVSYFKLDKYEEALSDFKIYEVKDPSHSEMNYYLSRIFYSKKDYVQSSACIEKALLKEKDFFNFYLQGEIYFQQGKNTLALKAFQSAQALDPEHGNVHYYIGVCHIRLGDKVKGCDFYQKAKELGASDMDNVIKQDCN